MALHASVCDRVLKRSPEKFALQKHQLRASKSENMQVIGNTMFISPIDCSVRISHEPDGLLSGDIQS